MAPYPADAPALLVQHYLEITVLEVDEGTQHRKTGTASPHDGHRLVPMRWLWSGRAELEENETCQRQDELADVKHDQMGTCVRCYRLVQLTYLWDLSRSLLAQMTWHSSFDFDARY